MDCLKLHCDQKCTNKLLCDDDRIYIIWLQRATHGGVSRAQIQRYGRIVHSKDGINVLFVNKGENAVFVLFSTFRRAFWPASCITAVQTNSKRLPITFFEVMTAMKHGQEAAV